MMTSVGWYIDSTQRSRKHFSSTTDRTMTQEHSQSNHPGSPYAQVNNATGSSSSKDLTPIIWKPSGASELLGTLRLATCADSKKRKDFGNGSMAPTVLKMSKWPRLLSWYTNHSPALSKDSNRVIEGASTTQEEGTLFVVRLAEGSNWAVGSSHRYSATVTATGVYMATQKGVSTRTGMCMHSPVHILTFTTNIWQIMA